MLLKLYLLVISAFFISGTACQTADTVFAETGSQAVLPCKSQVEISSSPIIVWTKVNQGTVWRRQKSGLQYWGISSNKEPRRVQCPHTGYEKGDYGLHISSIKKEDGGLYSCKVDFNGQMTESHVTLQVIIGIIQPSTDGLRLYAAAGSIVTLPCVFHPGLLPLNSTLEKLAEDSMFGQAATHSPPPFSPSPIRLPWDKSASLNAVGLESEGLYRCVGIVEGLRLTRTMRLVVGKIIPSKTNDSLTLTCRLGDTTEVTLYEWILVTSGSNGTKSAEIIQSGKTTQITIVSEKDSGEWMCRFYGESGILGNVTFQVEKITTVAGLSEQKSSDISYNYTTVTGISIFILILLLILPQMYKKHQRRKRIYNFFALETIIHANSNEQTEKKGIQGKK